MSKYKIGDVVSVFNPHSSMLKSAKGIIVNITRYSYEVKYFSGESPSGLPVGKWTAPYMSLVTPIEEFEGEITFEI